MTMIRKMHRRALGALLALGLLPAWPTTQAAA